VRHRRHGVPRQSLPNMAMANFLPGKTLYSRARTAGAGWVIAWKAEGKTRPAYSPRESASAFPNRSCIRRPPDMATSAFRALSHAGANMARGDDNAMEEMSACAECQASNASSAPGYCGDGTGVCSTRAAAGSCVRSQGVDGTFRAGAAVRRTNVPLVSLPFLARLQQSFALTSRNIRRLETPKKWVTLLADLKDRQRERDLLRASHLHHDKWRHRWTPIIGTSCVQWAISRYTFDLCGLLRRQVWQR
jgi:hypothetical protein